MQSLLLKHCYKFNIFLIYLVSLRFWWRTVLLLKLVEVFLSTLREVRNFVSPNVVFLDLRIVRQQCFAGLHRFEHIIIYAFWTLLSWYPELVLWRLNTGTSTVHTPGYCRVISEEGGLLDWILGKSGFTIATIYTIVVDWQFSYLLGRRFGTHSHRHS